MKQTVSLVLVLVVMFQTALSSNQLFSQTAWLNDPVKKLITVSEPISGYVIKPPMSEEITTDFSPASMYATIQALLGVSEVDTSGVTRKWINAKKLKSVYGNATVAAHAELTFVTESGNYISGGIVYCLDIENGDNVRNFVAYQQKVNADSLVNYADQNYELYRALTLLCYEDFAQAYEEELCIKNVEGGKSLNLIELYLTKWESGDLQRKCH